MEKHRAAGFVVTGLLLLCATATASNRACPDGWWGESCSIPCHCYQGDACDRESGVCPRGCSKGWAEPSCIEVSYSTSVGYHCMRAADDSLRAFVTVEHGYEEFPVIRAVGQDARPLACPEDRMTVSRRSYLLHVTLFLPGAFADFADVAGRDKCIADWTDNGTVTWLIEIKRYENLTVGDDVTVKVTCDLSDASSLINEASFADDGAVDKPLSPEMSPVKISVVVVNFHSGQVIDRFHLGQTLQLQVKVDAGSLEYYECPYPRSCVARTRDAGADDKGFVLVDGKGCPAAGSPITSLQVTSDAILSNPFPAFTLGGDSVVIQCEIDIGMRKGFRDCPVPDCPIDK